MLMPMAMILMPTKLHGLMPKIFISLRTENGVSRRRDVAELGNHEDADNIAWVDAMNEHLADLSQQGIDANGKIWQWNLANKAYAILYIHGEDMFYGTDKYGRGPNMRWRESGKDVDREDARIKEIGIPNSEFNWPHVKWFLEEVYKMEMEE
jgi:hypothetical protein